MVARGDGENRPLRPYLIFCFPGKDSFKTPYTRELKKSPIPENLHPKTGLYDRKPELYLANFLLHVYGALLRVERKLT